MAKQTIVGAGTGHDRSIDLGPLRYLVELRKADDVNYVVYRLSYAGKYIIIKGKTLAGSLIIIADTLASFDPNNPRFKGHLYTHLYTHLMDNPGGRFRVKIIASAQQEEDYYQLLKSEQMELDAARFDQTCLNNQVEAYIPNYNEKTAMYGWLPRTAVMNFKKWLTSKERKDHAAQYKK